MPPKFVVNAKFLEKGSKENNGILRYCREIAVRLKFFDERIQFLSSKGIESNSYSNLLQPQSFGRFKGALWEQLELPAYLNKHYKGYYLLNLNNISPLLYSKNISAVHDLTWKHFPEMFDLKAKVYLSTAMPRTIKNASKIITVSNYSKSELLKSYPLKEENIKVIYPGFYQNDTTKTYISESGQLSEHKLTAQGYFLAPMYKNPERLMNAFKLLDDKNVKLAFFGSYYKDVFGHLIPEIEASENMVYLGKVPDSLLSLLYANAIAFVFPSLNEGFGAPPLEAMSHDCPVVASNLASIPEVCGNAALYIDPYNIEDIAEKLRLISKDKSFRTDLIAEGAKRFRMFSYDRTVTELVDYFKSIGIYN